MRIGIVGAGLAGLTAARALAADGHDVVVFDKGRSPGGRMATRRIGAATFDHGAQFFTVRSEAFEQMVAGWRRSGLVQEWCRGFGEADGYARYAVRGGMNALPKHLARGLDVRTGTLAFTLRPHERGAGWTIGLDDGTAVAVHAAVLTAPLPQSFSLMVTSGVEAPVPLREIDYDCTLALLAVLDGPSAVPAPGGVQHPVGTFSFIGDNRAKGVSAVSAVTFHAAAAWSSDWWERDPDETRAELRRLAEPWLGGAAVVESQLKRWRFATPRSTWPEPCWAAPTDAPLLLAGDAFAGPKVEGAVLSGLAAAAALRDR